MERLTSRNLGLEPADRLAIVLAVFLTGLFCQGRLAAQTLFGNDQKNYGFCIGSTDMAVYASDVFELKTAAALRQADQDWRAYLGSLYHTEGACQEIKATSKQAAYSALDSAAWRAQQAVNAAGQVQARQIFHTGWRASG